MSPAGKAHPDPRRWRGFDGLPLSPNNDLLTCLNSSDRGDTGYFEQPFSSKGVKLATLGCFPLPTWQL